LLEAEGQLGRGGGLPRALEAAEEDHRRRPGGELDPGVLAAHQGRQLVPDNTDHLLGRREALQDLLAHRPGPDPLQEVFHHPEVDVRLQEGPPHLFEGLIYIRGRELAPAREAAEGLLQPLGQPFKGHDSPPLGAGSASCTRPCRSSAASLRASARSPAGSARSASTRWAVSMSRPKCSAWARRAATSPKMRSIFSKVRWDRRRMS